MPDDVQSVSQQMERSSDRSVCVCDVAERNKVRDRKWAGDVIPCAALQFKVHSPLTSFRRTKEATHG